MLVLLCFVDCWSPRHLAEDARAHIGEDVRAHIEEDARAHIGEDAPAHIEEDTYALTMINGELTRVRIARKK